jgi:hypothetical protein
MIGRRGKTMSYTTVTQKSTEYLNSRYSRRTMCAVAPSTLRTVQYALYIPVGLCLCDEMYPKVSFLLFRIIQHIPFHKTCTSWALKLCSLCSHVWQLLSLDVPIHHISSIAGYDQSLQTIPRAPLPHRTPCMTVYSRVTMTHRQNDRTSSMTTAAHDW